MYVQSSLLFHNYDRFSIIKWKASDEIPVSWKRHYRFHPCIPVDFRSVDRALATLFHTKHKSHHKVHSSVHVLFRPGIYNIQKTILICADQGQIQVTFEKIMNFQPASTVCHHREIIMYDPTHTTRHQGFQGEVFLNFIGSKSNCPLFRVENGHLVIRELQLRHKSSGFDIWGGNAVIHVEAKHGLARVSLERCDISSRSGRGIVITNDGKLMLRQCIIHGCAATGVYICGSDSTAEITLTDIIGNGHGGRGLARGHSGVCLENGIVAIVDSNISHNSASGISVITTEEWRLKLSQSDLIGNGAKPLDLPNGRTLPSILRTGERNNNNNGNRLGASGPTRHRSALPQTWSWTAQQTDFEEFIAM